MALFLFYLFGAGALLAAANVVLRRQAIPAAVWMVTCFFFLAGEFLLLGSSFLAAAQVLIYVGAIMVLVLFVIMLLDLHAVQPLHGQIRKAAGLGMAAVLAATAVVAGAGGHAMRESRVPGLDALVTALFTKYLLPFEITSILLVAAIVGALTLGRTGDSSPEGRA